MATIKARIAADNPEMDGVQSVSVFGNVLSREYAEIDVSDDVFAKLKGNPSVDVLVRKGKAAEPAPVEPEAKG
jgi:hypothetical protein